MSGLSRIAVGIEYDGTAYNGWQYQPHAPSIQQTMNDAISAVADEAVQCVGSGRTDTGVHASGQVAHFDTIAERTNRAWLLGINSHLPDDINALWISKVEPEFHARYSARERVYRYRILNRPVRSALHRDRAWWLRTPLDETLMAQAAASLVGEHDFSAFRAAGCQAHSPVRHMHRVDVSRTADWVDVECHANAFLHHMVRNIVGSLAKIGAGDAPVGWMHELLVGRDRTRAGITAPAAGLTLTEISFAPEFDLDS